MAGKQVVTDAAAAAPSNPPENQNAAPVATNISATTEQFDYAKWYEAQPEEAINEVANRVYQAAYTDINKRLTDEFGEDLLPILVEAKNDPELRKALKSYVKDDPELRKFLFGPAVDAYRATTRTEPTTGVADDNPLKKELDEVKGKLEAQENERQLQAYVQHRNAELEALQREAPELRFEKADPSDPAFRLASHVAEVAEERTRRFGKNVAYKDVYLELRDVIHREKPAAAPATSRNTAPPKPQPPKTQAEGRDRALETLKRAGGIAGLARAAGGRK